MAYLAGETISDSVYVTDLSDNPSVLAPASVFSAATVTRPDSTTFAPTIAATATPGLYTISFVTLVAQPGNWSVLLVSSETGTPYLATYDVDLGVTVVPTLTPTGAPVASMADIRIEVAIELRDGLICTATANGSPNTFIDDQNLTDSPDQYRASHGIVISAANGFNVGQQVRVDSSSPLTTALTFAANLPAATTVGDVLHLVNLGGYGFRPQYYDQAIKAAVAAAFSDALLDVVVTGSTPFDADVPTIPIPSPLCAVYAVELSETGSEWRTLPQARRPGRWGEGWTIDRASREIRVDGGWRDIADGLTYRLRGYGAHPVPQRASDPITLDRTWLVLDVKARLAARRGTDRQWQSWAVEWGRMAQQTRAAIATSLEPNTELL